MNGLSKKEIEIISDLEFRKMYYFTAKDIGQFCNNKKHLYNIIHRLRKKERIIRLNKIKYFLVPIRARTGKWTDDSRIVADEILNGKDYAIGGWFAANYWKLTDQIPMQIDIYTTKKQGTKKIMNMRYIFHRTTKKRLEKSIRVKLENHTFRIINKNEMEKWMKLRN